jgi:hypothetical protein
MILVIEVPEGSIFSISKHKWCPAVERQLLRSAKAAAGNVLTAASISLAVELLCLFTG